MSKLLGVAVILVAVAGCAAPSTTHQTGPAAPGGPSGSASPAVGASGPGSPPAGNATTPAGKGTTTKPPTAATSKSPAASGSKPPGGGVSYDPFDSPHCTWVPRMFVDLSGKAKPGVRVRMSLWATGLTGPVTFSVRGELNGPDRYRTTDTVTTNTTPEWRGTTSLAMAVPASGDYFSVALTFDTDHKVSNISGHTGLEATLPSPRPTADTDLPCQRVT
jgi:hypothetical protein